MSSLSPRMARSVAPAEPVEVRANAGLRTARMVLRPLRESDRAAYIAAVLESRAALEASMPMHRAGESDDQMFARQLAMVDRKSVV